MKKVLLVFLGVVLLSQAFKLWQRQHDSASVRDTVPAGSHQHHPGHGAPKDAGPKIMIT